MVLKNIVRLIKLCNKSSKTCYQVIPKTQKDCFRSRTKFLNTYFPINLSRNLLWFSGHCNCLWMRWGRFESYLGCLLWKKSLRSKEILLMRRQIATRRYKKEWETNPILKLRGLKIFYTNDCNTEQQQLLLRIPTGWRQTSWLFTAVSRCWSLGVRFKDGAYYCCCANILRISR